MRVGLKKYSVRLYAIFDARALPSLGVESVYDVIAEGIRALLEKSSGSVRRLLASALSRVEGVSLAGVEVRFSKRSAAVLYKLFEALSRVSEDIGATMVLVFDEAQEFTVIPGFQKLLAHIYDYHHAIKLVLAGSEVGLLDRLLGRGNPRAPLYGRPYLEIEMPRLPRELAVDFLKTGFKELGVEWPHNFIEEAVDMLDGIPGWLTAYGYYAYTMRDHEKALRRVVEEGAAMARAELERFLANRMQARQRYLTILRCLALKPMRWSELKLCLETRIGRRLNNSQFTRYLHELRDYSFIEKAGEEYRLADPLIAHALKLLR